LLPVTRQEFQKSFALGICLVVKSALLPRMAWSFDAARNCLPVRMAVRALQDADGDDAMHFANYIVLGLLIVCTISAAAMVLSRAKSL
jgi:hypothetical protein